MFRFFLIYLICLNLFAAGLFAQDGVQSNQQRFGSEQPKKRYEETKKVIDRVKQDQSLGKQVAEKYSSKAAPGGRFPDHPYKGFNPWVQTWLADSKIIDMGLPKGMDDLAHPCANWHLIAVNNPQCFGEVKWLIETRHPLWEVIGCCDSRISGDAFETWEFWRAENQYEANNFGISEQQMTANLRPLYAAVKDITLLTNMLALVMRGGDSRPGGLKADPHLGQSHFEGSGGLPFAGMDSNYEARVVRTYHDDKRAYDYDQGDDLYYLKECMPPKKDVDHAGPLVKRKRFATFHSERIPELWRLPELSKQRLEQGASQPYINLHKQLPEISLKVGHDYYGKASMNPVSGFMNHRAAPKPPGVGSLAQDTCSSYWLADKARWGKFGESEFPMDKATNNKIQPAHGNEDAWKRLCYHPSVGTLYPLIGAVQSDVNSIAPLAAIRRFMDWTSWEGIYGKTQNDQFDHKTNYMDDHPSAGIYTNQVGVVASGARAVDKMQRLAPSPSECFNMDQVHPRNPTFRGDLTTPDFKGSWRYAHWNRRRGCLCKSPLVRLRIFPFTIRCAPEWPACIPEEE